MRRFTIEDEIATDHNVDLRDLFFMTDMDGDELDKVVDLPVGGVVILDERQNLKVTRTE